VSSRLSGDIDELFDGHLLRHAERERGVPESPAASGATPAAVRVKKPGG
jgi:hypothetical protein